MPHDLIIKNGKVIDGSGLPGFHGDVAVSGGRIVEIGKVNGEARQVLNADGLVVAPGIIDNHTHYDAQVTWDPLCTYSCYHGITTVVMGNCSLAMAPAHKEDREMLSGVLSHVEAIPLEAIQAGVKWSWETIPEYLDALDERLGINVASLIGHSAVRRYVMGEASQERHATDDEVTAMKAIVREGLEAGAVGVSFERNLRHFDWNGRLAPTNLASEEEIFAVAGVADEVGRGVIQFGGDRGISTKLAKASRRPVFYGNITQQAVAPDKWRKQLGEAESLMRQGHRGYQFVMPRPGDLRYTLKTAQHFDAWPPGKMSCCCRTSCATKHSATRRPAPNCIGKRSRRRWIPTAPATSRADGICSSYSSPHWRRTNISRARASPRLRGNRTKTCSTHSSIWRWKKIWKPNSNGAKSTATKRP